MNTEEVFFKPNAASVRKFNSVCIQGGDDVVESFGASADVVITRRFHIANRVDPDVRANRQLLLI